LETIDLPPRRDELTKSDEEPGNGLGGFRAGTTMRLCKPPRALQLAAVC